MPGPDTGVAFSYQQYAAAEYLRRLLEGAFRRTGTNIKEVSVDSDYSGCADVIVLYESGQIHADYIQVKSRLRSSGPDWEKLWCKFIQLQLDAEQNKNVFRYVLAAPPFHSVSALEVSSRGV